MWLDFSWHSLPSTAASVALWFTVWYQWAFSFSFFLYSPWFPCVTLYNFKLALWFVFSSYLIHLLLIAIFLFQIIYKINFFFNFILFQFFHLLDLVLILFTGIFLFLIIFLIEFAFQFYLSSFNFFLFLCQIWSLFFLLLFVLLRQVF